MQGQVLGMDFSMVIVPRRIVKRLLRQATSEGRIRAWLGACSCACTARKLTGASNFVRCNIISCMAPNRIWIVICVSLVAP